MGKIKGFMIKQWQRVNQTYNFIKVPVDVLKLLLWFFIFVELSDIIPLTIENILIRGVIAGATLMGLGYLLERGRVFHEYQSQVNKILTAENDMHRWRMSGAYVARAIRISKGLDTSDIDEYITEEKKWFFPRGVPEDLKDAEENGNTETETK